MAEDGATKVVHAGDGMGGELVLDDLGTAFISKAASEPFDQVNRLIGRSRQCLLVRRRL